VSSEQAGEQAPEQPVGQTHDYYGVPLWLMKDYLIQLGAEETSENELAAEGWRASLRKADPRHLGSLVIGGTTATFYGDQQALAAMYERLHWKTLRGGG
jgi:hypothetical protein